jgi:hypothetical protein
MKGAQKIFFVLLILGVLLLLGCGGSSSQTPGIVKYNFQTGTTGLVINFLPNAPPEKIYPFSGFKMIMDLENQAGYPLKNGKIRIVGLDNKYFGLDQTEQDFGSLEGRSMINPLGGRTRIEFNGKAYQLFSNSEQYVGNYFLQASYESNMDFVDTVCLNPNMYETYDAGCKTNHKKNYAGQGAPLAVASLDQITYPVNTGGGVEFRLSLKNMGPGKAEKVTLVKAQLGGENLACEVVGNKNQPSGQNLTLVFDENKQEGTLICRSSMKQGSSYSTTLYLGFTYSYRWEQKYRLTLVK